MDAGPSKPNTQRAYWLCQLVGWGLYGAARSYSVVLIGEVSWLRATVAAAVVISTGIILSHGLRLFMRRRGWRGMPLARRIPRVIAASLILGTPPALLLVLLGAAPSQSDLIPLGPPAWQPFVPFLIEPLNMSAVFLLWTAIYFGALTFREHKARALREAELARVLQATELRLLKSQLNPHFLFNALNAVRALIADEPARAQDAVTQLARTLRYTLGSGQGELVTLDQELATVEDYLALEALRLGERLRVDMDVAPQARKVRIPIMLMQTLVENAIKHGIGELPEGGVLHIRARTADGVLLLEVENPRPEPPGQRTPEGIGLLNAQRRLHLLFGAKATLNLDLSEPARALARVSLPLTA